MMQTSVKFMLIRRSDSIIGDPCKASDLTPVHQRKSIEMSVPNFLISACCLLCLSLLCQFLYDKKHCLNAIENDRHTYTPSKIIPVKFDRGQKLLKHFVNRKLALINSKHRLKSKTKDFHRHLVLPVKHEQTHGDKLQMHGSVPNQPCQDLDDDNPASGQPNIAVVQQHGTEGINYVESVMVNDQPSKDKELSRGNQNEHTPPSLRYRYSPALDAILFRPDEIVRASAIDAQELYHVYEMPTSELKAKCVQEAHRLATYDGLFNSQHMTTISLARAGLINLKRNNDTVVCVWCLVQFRNFKQAIDASALHFAYSEHLCEFIKHYPRLNVPIAKSQGSDQPEAFLDLATNAQGNKYY